MDLIQNAAAIIVRKDLMIRTSLVGIRSAKAEGAAQPLSYGVLQIFSKRKSVLPD